MAALLGHFLCAKPHAKVFMCMSHLSLSLHEEGTIIPILHVRKGETMAGKEAGRISKLTYGDGIREKPDYSKSEKFRTAHASTS